MTGEESTRFLPGIHLEKKWKANIAPSRTSWVMRSNVLFTTHFPTGQIPMKHHEKAKSFHEKAGSTGNLAISVCERLVTFCGMNTTRNVEIQQFSCGAMKSTESLESIIERGPQCIAKLLASLVQLRLRVPSRVSHDFGDLAVFVPVDIVEQKGVFVTGW
jgi:hypothetical protein